jgi:hypothetical protein
MGIFVQRDNITKWMTIVHRTKCLSNRVSAEQSGCRTKWLSNKATVETYSAYKLRYNWSEICKYFYGQTFDSNYFVFYDCCTGRNSKDLRLKKISIKPCLNKYVSIFTAK